jgi:hypothetical protein
MNVESAVRESLEAIAGELTRPPRKGHHAAMQRGRRRRTVRRLGGSVLGLGVAYGFLLIPAAVTPSIVADGGETEVAVAMIPASVSGRAPGSEVVWLGEIGPEPQFDTSALGPDLSFDPVDPDVAALEALEGLGAWSERSPDKVVYLGELDGEPMFLFSVAPPSVLDLVFEYAFGNWSGRIYGTPLNCCGSIADIPPEGLPTFGSWRETIEGGVVESGGYLEWLALPPETSVVSLSAAGIDLGWQRPVGRAVMLPLDQSFLGDDGLVRDPKLVAYGADGTVLASLDMTGRRMVLDWVDAALDGRFQDAADLTYGDAGEPEAMDNFARQLRQLSERGTPKISIFALLDPVEAATVEPLEYLCLNLVFGDQVVSGAMVLRDWDVLGSKIWEFRPRTVGCEEQD